MTDTTKLEVTGAVAAERPVLLQAVADRTHARRLLAGWVVRSKVLRFNHD